MKTSTTTIVLAVALAVVAGLFSSTIFGLMGAKTDSTKADAAAMFTGHVETVVRDADGNIKEYRQTDNLVVDQGEHCAIKMLFGGGDALGAGSNTCTGEIDSGFTVIAIGTGTGAAAAGDVALAAESTTGTLARAAGTIDSFTNATGAQSSVVISNTFTNDSGGQVTIAESGLFNSTSTNADGMFARQTFTGISLNNNDQLTVTWTINVGGTAGFS